MGFVSETMGLLTKGGIFMIPLALVGLVGVVLTIERLLFLRENRIDGDRFHYELKNALQDDDIDSAVVIAAKTKGLVGRVMEQGLLKVQSGKRDIVAATEKALHSEMNAMEKSRGWLMTVAQVAPLLGIVGTVYGMIIAFMAIEQTASTDPALLAGGIYQALITTLVGLIIAIGAMIVAEYIRREANQILHYLDLFLIEVRDWLDKRPGDEPQPAASDAATRNSQASASTTSETAAPDASASQTQEAATHG